jgi:hypothetical protein
MHADGQSANYVPQHLCLAPRIVQDIDGIGARRDAELRGLGQHTKCRICVRNARLAGAKKPEWDSSRRPSPVSLSHSNGGKRA